MANAVDPHTPAGETPVSTETARAPTAARRYADKDPLDRQALADALADELYGHAIGPKDIDPGPTVVTIEGPWGSGKSTLMDLVRKQLPDPPRSTASPRRLTVRMASRQLRDGPVEQLPVAETAAPERRRGVVTAWFNPWAHQSGEQVWAGLVAEIIEAAHPVLYPTEAAREHYWFARNLTRVDRYALRRTLHRRTRSPELTVGALGVVASLAIALAGLETTRQHRRSPDPHRCHRPRTVDDLPASGRGAHGLAVPERLRGEIPARRALPWPGQFNRRS
jgi:hypothetical protein